MSRILHGHRPTFLSPLVQHAPLQELLDLIAQIAEDRAPGIKCVISVDDAGHSLDNIQDDGWHRPIQSSKGETIGSIHLCSQDGASMEDPKQLLEELYQLAAVAYDRHQLQIEVIERSRLAALAVRISGILSRSISLTQMLQECTEALVQDLDMVFARIWLLNEAETMLLLAASAGLSTNLHGAYSRVPVATSLKIGRMVRERQPMLTNRILEEAWIKEPEWAKREGLVAYAGYPLIAEDRVVGVIAMFSKNTVPENTLQALAAIAAGLAQAITKARADEQRLERVRELEALHQTASLLQVNAAVPALLQQVVSLLPSAWRYAAVAEARIMFMGQEYSTPGFCLTPWHQMADFRLTDGRSGRLEIVYREERPAEAEGPFLAEERRLIDSLAEMLGNYLNRKQAERELLESRDALRRMNATLEEQVEERTRQLIGKQEELRSLAIALSRTEEQARQQLATDLHDNLAQMLALARMKLQGDPALKTSRTLQDVNELLGESLGYTRTVMADLRPPLLSDAHDLYRAISWVVDRVQRRGLSVTVETDSEPIVLDEEVLTVTYQAIHELLFNVLKHAKTKEARLTLKCQHQFLDAVVTDYGEGFDVGHRSTTSKEGGFGLLNIQERVELLGGRLEISSQIGKGTCSKVTMPLRGVTSRSHVLDPSSSPHAAENIAGILEGQGEAVSAMMQILLVDDHPLVRAGLRSILEEQPAYCVVAEASDGQMAIEAARELRPNIVVMDVNMPTMNGLEATRRITSEFPEIAVIGLSMNDDEAVIGAMREAGAIGYVSKTEAADKLVDTIEAARSAKVKGQGLRPPA
jgi:signal transduction histidine kinase/CheY-like chemotaxis protein